MATKTTQATLPIEQSVNASQAEAFEGPVPEGKLSAQQVQAAGNHRVEYLILKAIEAGTPIETMERLLAMRDRLKAEQAKEAFFAALSAAQSEFPIIPKNKAADRYKYAPMDVIVTHVQPILAKHGLSHTIKSEFTDTHVIAICHVHHVGGHSEASSFKAPIDRNARINDIQKTAAARTYAMRYAFCDAYGIVSGDEDNDAQTVRTTKHETYKLNPEATVDRVRDLALEKGADIGEICRYYDVETLDDLTAGQRSDAVGILVARPAKAAR